jgi:hypothetical protein
MPESLSARKLALSRPRTPRPREVSDLLGRRDEGATIVDASYGDTLRGQMPRRLSALTRPRRGAAP